MRRGCRLPCQHSLTGMLECPCRPLTCHAFLLRTAGVAEAPTGAAKEAKRVRVLQLLPPSLAGRAHVFGNKLALKETAVLTDLPYFDAPGKRRTCSRTCCALRPPTPTPPRSAPPCSPSWPCTPFCPPAGALQSAVTSLLSASINPQLAPPLTLPPLQAPCSPTSPAC
jgi:hypothetical protein